jgi:hypothetical protein
VFLYVVKIMYIMPVKWLHDLADPPFVMGVKSM